MTPKRQKKPAAFAGRNVTALCVNAQQSIHASYHPQCQPHHLLPRTLRARVNLYALVYRPVLILYDNGVCVPTC